MVATGKLKYNRKRKPKNSYRLSKKLNNENHGNKKKESKK
jgi:hypothetical protein